MQNTKAFMQGDPNNNNLWRDKDDVSDREILLIHSIEENIRKSLTTIIMILRH